jgi:hypothetical protein
MKRTGLLVALLVIVGMLVVPAAGVVAQETDDEDGKAEIAPGERLSGVVGVQQAEFDGEIERNAFRIALERADDNATKASRIAEKLNQSQERLAELNERKAELQQQRETGNITEGKYRARMAKTATEIENTKQQLNQSNETAAQLPAETLEANGVNTTAIRALMNNASEMSGGEVSEIARSIAGDRSGMVDRGAAGDRGPGEDRGGERGPGGESDDSDGDAADQRPNGGEQAPNGTETPDHDSGAQRESRANGDDRDAGSDGRSTDGNDGASAGNAGNR